MIAAIARRYFGLEAGLFTGPLAIGNRDLVQLSIASVVGNTATTAHYVVLVIVAIAMTGLLIIITPWAGLLGIPLGRIHAYDLAIYSLALYQAVGQYSEFHDDEARVSELRMANLDGATVAANFMLPETHKWRSFLVILAVVETSIFASILWFDTMNLRMLTLTSSIRESSIQVAGAMLLLLAAATAMAYLHYESVRLARTMCLHLLINPWHPTKTPAGFAFQGGLYTVTLGFSGFVLCAALTYSFVVALDREAIPIPRGVVGHLMVASAFVTPIMITAILAGWTKRLIAGRYLAKFAHDWDAAHSPQSP